MRGGVGERTDLTTRGLGGRSEVEDGKGGGQVTLFGKGRKTRAEPRAARGAHLHRQVAVVAHEERLL